MPGVKSWPGKYNFEGPREYSVAREWLGELPFFTAHHTVPRGTVTSTRIDIIYASDTDGTAWEHVQVAHDIFGRDPAARELDHEMAVI